MTTRAAYHNDTSALFLGKARAYLAEGDLLQASEKGWGAAAQAVKAIAETRGWDHRGHRQLHQAVDRLVAETGQAELRTLFASANILHSNFYDGFLSEEAVSGYLKDVERFVEQLPA